MTFISLAAARRVPVQPSAVAEGDHRAVGDPDRDLLQRDARQRSGLTDYYISEQFGRGFAHTFYGLVMYVPAFFLMLMVGWILDHLFLDEADEKEKAKLASAARLKLIVSKVAAGRPRPRGCPPPSKTATIPATAAGAPHPLPLPFPPPRAARRSLAAASVIRKAGWPRRGKTDRTRREAAARGGSAPVCPPACAREVKSQAPAAQAARRPPQPKPLSAPIRSSNSTEGNR